MATDTTGIGGLLAVADRQHAWVASGSAMLHTADRGLSWQRQQTGTSAAPFNGISVVSTQDVWATAYSRPDQGFPPHQPSSLLHTVDGGATWQSVDVPGYGIFLGVWFVGPDGWVLATQCHPGDPTDPASVDPSPCIDKRRLLHTPDGGRTWSALREPAGGLDGKIARVDTLVAYRVGGVMYQKGLCEAGCAGGHLYRTSDRGETWTSVLAEPGLNDAILSLRFTDPLDGWIADVEYAPPTNPPAALPEHRSRLAHTRDGGVSWTYVDLPSLRAGTFDLTSAHVVTNAGADGIVLYDIEKGTWQQAVADARPALERLMFVTRDRGYAVADSGDGRGTRNPWVTEDGGVSWAPWVTPEHLIVTTLTADAIWATGDQGLYRSSDGGMSWREVGLPPEVDAKSRFSVQASAGDRVWLVAGVWLWRSDDAGATWRGIDIEPEPAYGYIDADHAWTTACWPADCRHEIRVTSDGGDTWVTRSIPVSVSVEGFTTPLDGWGSNADGAARGRRSRTVTQDGGVTWQAQPAPFLAPAGQFFELIAVDDDRAFGLAYDLNAPHEWHISATRDGGATWVNELTLDVRAGVPVAVVAHGRIWITFTRLSAGSDIPGPPNRVTIYRKDVDPPAVPVNVSGEAPSHGKPLLVALLAGFALASTLVITGITRRALR